MRLFGLAGGVFGEMVGVVGVGVVVGREVELFFCFSRIR